jgi:rod shape-determining protein MreC
MCLSVGSVKLMKRKTGFLSTFLVVFFLCVLILVLSVSGKLNFISSFLGKGTSVISSATFNIFQKLPFASESKRVKELESEKLELASRVANLEKLKKENQALSDQFRVPYPQSAQLLETDIIGMSSFIPGVSVPNSFIIDKGSRDNLKVGLAIIIKNNLIGIISRVSSNIAEVKIVNNSSISFTAKTQNGVVGIIKGGDVLTLDGILLSENIKTGEIVLTKGDVNNDGIGIPPDLVVGKITSVEKNPSSLFQRAKVESFINFINLSTVFIFM